MRAPRAFTSQAESRPAILARDGERQNDAPMTVRGNRSSASDAPRRDAPEAPLSRSPEAPSRDLSAPSHQRPASARRIVEGARLSNQARITFRVTACSRYADRRLASIREMEEIA